MKRIAVVALVLVLVGSAPAPASTNTWHSTPVAATKGDINAIATQNDQAWAVGYQLTSLTTLESFLLRWNGATWKRESTLPKQALPKAVAVSRPNYIWTAGRTEDVQLEGLETAHWNGTAWSSHSVAPDPGGVVMLEAVTTVGAKAWVAGRALRDSIKVGVPVVQSWNGAAWQREVLPDVGPGELTSITARAANDVWAAGAAYTNPQTPLLFHFNGTEWRKVDVPGRLTWLSGVTVLGPNDVWVAGGTYAARGDLPFAAHWDGRKWTVTYTPKIADARLRSIVRTTDGKIWAVGGKGDVAVALQWQPMLRMWSRVRAPDVVVRGVAASGNTLWAGGIARQGDLVPAIARKGL